MSKFIFLSFLYYFCILFSFGNTSDENEIKIPPFLKVCNRNEPKLNQCLMDSVELLRPSLAKGIPELLIPACEPLFIPEIIMNQGRGSVSVQSIYRNIKIYGPSNFILKNIQIDFDKNRMRLKLSLPNLYMTSNYTLQGHILMMPISGTGLSHGNYSDIDTLIDIQGRKFSKDNQLYFDVTDVSASFTIGHATLHFSNLFNGDQELGDAMNSFLNENWKNVAQDVKPVLEETIAELVKRFSNKIFHRYSLDLILPV